MNLDQFNRPLATATVEDTVEKAAVIMRDQHVGCLIITRDGRPAGIVTDRDLVLRVLAEGVDPSTVKLGQFVTFDPITISVKESVATAAERMRKHGVRRLPIVDDRGVAVGIITADDLLMMLGRQIGAVCEAIENRADADESA
jgi:CBS domain-containing protein